MRGKELFSSLKEHAWVINLALTIFVLALTQYQLYTQSRSIVVVNCWLADSKEVNVSFDTDRFSVAFATRCAVRNVGAKPVEITEVRSGLTLRSKLISEPKNISKPFESASQVKVNDAPILKPVAIQPNSQATVEAFIHFSTLANETNKVKQLLAECTSQNKIEVSDALEACLKKGDLRWTDFLRGSGREVLDDFDPSSVADGLAAVFLLSSGGFVSEEISFQYGWGWSCGPSAAKLGPPPAYVHCQQLGR